MPLPTRKPDKAMLAAELAAKRGLYLASRKPGDVLGCRVISYGDDGEIDFDQPVYGIVDGRHQLYGQTLPATRVRFDATDFTVVLWHDHGASMPTKLAGYAIRQPGFIGTIVVADLQSNGDDISQLPLPPNYTPPVADPIRPPRHRPFLEGK